jgi:hypothetical protein
VLHEGSIAIDRSPMGGLRATLKLPASQSAEAPGTIDMLQS